MSNVYNLEPPTKGKVILKTTHGDLEIELWAKEAPRACRNFVQLCMEGYYDDCLFHRIVKDFMVQTGDPTGTGKGGESIYGEPFKDEIHSRLRFTHRGIVACANRNEPHTNNSQFFITLDRCPWLDRKHTIFGKVEGDTVYNLARLNDIEVDEDERPVGEPPRVLSTEIVWNPFEDIVPRSTKEEREVQAREEREKEERKAREERKKQAVKNASLLSFDDVEDEDGSFSGPGKRRGGGIKAAHEVLDDGRLESAKEAEKRAQEEEKEKAATLERVRGVLGHGGRSGADGSGGGRDSEAEEGGEEGGMDFASKMRARVAAKRKALGKEVEVKRPGKRARGDSEGEEDLDFEERDEESGERSERGVAGATRGAVEYDRERVTAKYEALRGSRMLFKGEVRDRELLTRDQGKLKEERMRKRAVGGREDSTMQRLSKFMANMSGGKSKGGAGHRAEKEREGDRGGGGDGNGKGDDRGYDGKVDKNINHRMTMPAAWRVDDYLDGSDDDDLSVLRSHKLKAEKPARDAMARDMGADDLVVIDPLLEKGKGKWSKKAQAEKKRKNEWAGRARD